MTKPITFATAHALTHNFTHYAALVDGGMEVIITRHGHAPLKLMQADEPPTRAKREAMLALALSFRLSKPYRGKFKRADAYPS
jgi:hypothetical protein